MGAVLFIIGCPGIISKKSKPAQWGVDVFLLIFFLLFYTLVYDLTVGSICYSLVAQLSSTRLRSKTIVLAGNCFTISALVTNTLVPRMLNPSAWNWGAKIGYFWAGPCLLCFIWVFSCLPEPKDRSYTALNVLFEQGVSARKFSSTFVDPFSGRNGGSLEDKGAVDTVVVKIERI
jgi:SP family general alpha glucoside:H+ symporter-like MFS transporter